jgi:hypothetical protein
MLMTTLSGAADYSRLTKLSGAWPEIRELFLQESALRLLYEHVQAYGKIETSPQFWEVLVDWDGVPFINYLDATDFEDGSGANRSLLQQHRDVVLEALEKFAKDAAIRPKYLWMAHYHNRFCTDAGMTDLQVADIELRHEYSRLPQIDLPTRKRYILTMTGGLAKADRGNTVEKKRNAKTKKRRKS